MSALDLIIDRLVAGQPVTVYELGGPCRFPDYSGIYSYRALGCKCRRCLAAHCEANTASAVIRRRHALERSRRRHPTGRDQGETR
jgi:hypothetical protein